MQHSFEYIRQSLSQLYTPSETAKLAVLILQYITNFSQANILTNKDTILSQNQYEKIQLIVDRLKKNEPLEYILGETLFLSLPIEVNGYTLIPRPETEELVDWIITDQIGKTSLRVLDIGTGSGCIAIALAKKMNAYVTAFDLSAGALEMAGKNAFKNGVVIDFVEMDILKAKPYHQKFDVIVSNPPYICEREKADMENNVLQYEPELALFVPDNDPLLFYRAIANFAILHLIKGGSLYFEINRAFGEEVCEMLMNKAFSTVELRKDLSGNDRMIKAVY